MEKMAKEMTKGECFAEELASGSFIKNFRPNHGVQFIGGCEQLHAYQFEKYVSSCGCFLMDRRLKRRGYCG